MFKKLIIRNFQVHKKLVIILDRYVTTIIGPNDAGKSAVIRALRWLCLNRPTGKGFIRRGAKQCLVRLSLRHNRKTRTITRRTDAGSNLYRVDSKSFKAFRNDVPPEIEKLLRVEEINFQRQHDSVFWFDLTPGQVAKELNKLVDLDSIDRAQTWISKRVRDKRAELAVARKRYKEARALVQQLSWVPKIDVKLGKLEKVRRYRLKSPGSHHIRGLIRSAMGSRQRQRAAAAAAAAATAAAAAAATARQTANRFRKLSGIIEDAKIASQLAKLPIPNLPERPKQSSKDLNNLIQKIDKNEIHLVQCHKFISRKNKTLEKKLGGRCPVCGGILTDKNPI